MKLQKTLYILIILSISFLFGCQYNKTDISSIFESYQTNDEYLPIFINGFQLEHSLDDIDGKVCDTKMLTTEMSNTIDFLGLDGYALFVNGQELDSNSRLELELDSLKQDEYIDIQLVSNDTAYSIDFSISTLHSLYLQYTEGKGADGGYYYFAIRPTGTIYKMDNLGNILFYKECNPHVFDFKPHEINGKLYYTYLEGAISNDDFILENVGYKQSRAVVMNDKYQVIDTVDHLFTTDYVMANHSLENHDFLMLDVGHYIISGYVAVEVDDFDTPNTKIAASVIQEIKDGELLMSFNSTNSKDLYAHSVEKNFYDTETYSDYLHVNSVSIDPRDENLVVSARNSDSLYKINRKTGEVMWTLGGLFDEFNLTEEQKFDKQHFAKFQEDGSLILFDNGTRNHQTRILEFFINDDDKTIENYQEHKLDRQYAISLGSAIKIDDSNYIFGWGINYFDNSIFWEANVDTEEVAFKLITTVKDNNSYRVYRFYK